MPSTTNPTNPDRQPPNPVAEPGASIVEQPVETPGQTLGIDAVEIDASCRPAATSRSAVSNLWLGPARAGRTVTLCIDTTTVHLSLDGQHLKTLPSRLTSIDLARLRAQGARPAGPPPPGATVVDPTVRRHTH